MALLPFGLVAWWLVSLTRPLTEGEVGDLLHQVSGLYGPLVVLIALVVFRHEIVQLMRRIEAATYGRFGVRFTAVDNLESQTVAAGAAQAELPPPPPPSPPPLPDEGAGAAAGGPLPQPDGGPPQALTPPPIPGSLPEWAAAVRFTRPERAELVDIANQLSRELYLLAASLGVPFSQRQQINESIVALVRRGTLTQQLAETIREFFDFRNDALYGSSVLAPPLLIRLLGIGQSLLNIVRSILRPTYRVVSVLDLFHDPAADQPYTDLTKGVLIRTTSPDGKITNEAVYPSRRQYPSGVRVSWDWDVSQKYSEAFYRKPSGEVVKGWDRSAEFIGEQLPD